MSEFSTQPTPDEVEAKIRQLGRQLFNMSALHQHESPDGRMNVQVEIAKLTAGLDPDTIDAASPEFRAGGAYALSVVLNALYEAPAFHRSI